MKAPDSAYLKQLKPTLRKLQQALSARYGYASVLAADGREHYYSVSARGISTTEDDEFGRRGFVARVHDGKAYAEYAATELNEVDIPAILEKIGNDLASLSTPFDRFVTPVAEEESLAFDRRTEYELFPDDLGDEKIIATMTDIRNDAMKMDERLLDCRVSISWQLIHKIFLSDKKDLEQHLLWTCGGLVVLARRGEEIKDSYRGYSGMCGIELLDTMRADVPDRVKTVCDLLDSEPLTPGTYDCVCTPSVTGMIVHEAFGHGVEMDMFVKDRALARSFIGQKVASDLVTMRDGAAAANEVASFFFDDEGTPASDTLIIDHGTLVAGMADGVSAARLGIRPTGNGRRESVERKAYTRMTNTFFEGGTDSVEDMIASVKDGLLLDEPSSGMEDPKNWGIQCMVSFAREIKDGKLTGRIFSPIVLSGYVPDLLKSISMMSPTVELGGSGACGKGYKEWVKVSDGGPWIRATIRLG